MSTTRPLLGMKRITEVTCTEPPGGRQSPTASKTHSEQLTVDEFTVHEDKQGELKCAKPRVEQVFQVAFTIIGLLDHTGAHGSKASRQIWLQLKGKKEDVSTAKEYVKGLCDPELQKEERYPVDMHCIFAGARGLFLDRLLRDTSAEVQVLEPGRLRLIGCAEAVVMAQSRIQQFVALFHEKRSLPADREPLVKRTFKTFVEDRADNYAMELLLLPSALKEELLGLAQSPTQSIVIIDLEQDRSQTSTPVTDLSNRILDTTFEDNASGPPSTSDITPGLNGRPCNKRRSSESEQRDTKRQFSLERREEEQLEERQREASQTRAVTPAKGIKGAMGLSPIEGINEGEAVSPETNLRCLVNFFRTMGYQQEVVERVVRETGQTEDTFLLLERIVEETQKTQSNQAAQRTSRTPDPSPSTNASSNCTRLKEKERVQMRALTEIKCKENIRPPSSNGIGQRNQTSTIPLTSVTLKRNNAVSNDVCDVIVIDDDDNDNDLVEVERKPRIIPLDLKSETRFDYLPRGSSQTMVPVRTESVTTLRSSSQGPPLRHSDMRPSCSYQTLPGRAPLPRAEVFTTPKSAPLTGMSRFQQSLKTPYRLVLQNEPGYPDLRHIIIDGSNVAMAHGLNRIFSCRGIAIAVEAFWRRGHREITVFVPQWRQKRDPNITEQHFLTQLENLRLLSFTPSREVCGQRISSHDDRFLLHLAEKTGGVIVTNDNLRDFVNQSEAWRRIIQQRLLQFTFVEDHFMIPDDPLGKHGPHLDVFLLKENRGSPITPPLRTDPRATPSVFTQAAQATPPPSSPSHWPHSGPPDWHLPRPSPSPPPQRSPSETTKLKKDLYDIFPDQKQRIDHILNDNPYMRDLNALSGLLLG
ncbi:NEDD4-binding protein 1 [Triplophysa rosa]|uniref:NEDD4-binding protein 1 n=1 Tax=Triplophysa rosa TaxID=992332 RepID=A0A9W7TUK6_TRIRA|nr:NEDD4-binding protein 1 [Triplophysa rosa]KAI7802522.1 NEDD4-binding protein 1 [Triplophysa rosa]